ncbi:MAG: aldo/keto reductase [Defluviitaleaceae bacterium]|nr:aldo/keto reductase [Defluviitaleaceae bacterium]
MKMIYKKFKDLRLSSLGMGCMRLPSVGNEWGTPIDEEKAMELIDRAYKSGVNYFDTSWFYHGGDSERFIGEALRRYPRDSWYLASKIAGMMMRKNDEGKYQLSGSNKDNKTFTDPTEIFEYQLNRCGVDRFDFFMLHNVSEGSYPVYTDESLGIVEAMLRQKEEGRIRHLGFSSHGRAETIEKFLTETKARYGDIFEFAMIQLNYLDWTLQKAGEKYDVLTRHGLPVMVMEPLRGGTLARLGEKPDAILKEANPGATQASWAFRYLQSLKNVSVVVSGMSSLEQLEENLETFGKHEPTNPLEDAVLREVLESLVELIPCTDCKYCVDECPQKLNIPMLLTMYNEAGFEMGWFLQAATIRTLKENEKPTACTGCGKCSPYCPQGIDIPEALGRFGKLLI